MKVQLVSLTQAVVKDGDKFLTPEQLIVYIARVSNPANQLNNATADKLLAYLIKQKHWSPFDMANLTVSVTTSKAIAIQILRHWSIHPQEFSQRYAEVTDIEPMEFRRQAATNRQSSTEKVGTVWQSKINTSLFNTDYVTTDPDITHLLFYIARHNQETLAIYKRGLSLGIAKECMRNILPMATSTTIMLNGTIRSWIFYLQQRTDSHAQAEHQEVAIEIKKIFDEHFPNIAKALKND